MGIPSTWLSSSNMAVPLWARGKQACTTLMTRQGDRQAFPKKPSKVDKLAGRPYQAHKNTESERPVLGVCKIEKSLFPLLKRDSSGVAIHTHTQATFFGREIPRVRFHSKSAWLRERTLFLSLLSPEMSPPPVCPATPGVFALGDR